MERVSDERLEYLTEIAAHDERTCEGNHYYEDIHSALRELVELRAQSRWVKIEERLPEDSSIVIVALGGVLKTVAHYNHRKKLWRPGNRPNGELVGVTHWREFPASPEEEGK